MFKNIAVVVNEEGQEQEINVDEWKNLNPVKAQGFDDFSEHDEQPMYGNYMNMASDGHYGEDMDLSKLLDEEYQEDKSQHNKYFRKQNTHYRSKEKHYKRASFDESKE